MSHGTALIHVEAVGLWTFTALGISIRPGIGAGSWGNPFDAPKHAKMLYFWCCLCISHSGPGAQIWFLHVTQAQHVCKDCCETWANPFFLMVSCPILLFEVLEPSKKRLVGWCLMFDVCVGFFVPFRIGIISSFIGIPINQRATEG